jgi:NitT/TauT family transport system substrate-binding protein
MAFADINALIRYRDQNPSAPVKAVFMVYNKPPYSIVARKNRGITEPKQLESKKLRAVGRRNLRAMAMFASSTI